MVEVVMLLIFLGQLKTQPFYEINEIHNNSYVVAAYKPPNTPPKPSNMVSADDDSGIPSLTAPVPPCGNDGQRPMQ